MDEKERELIVNFAMAILPRGIVSKMKFFGVFDKFILAAMAFKVLGEHQGDLAKALDDDKVKKIIDLLGN